MSTAALVFVEDPGAANYLADVPRALREAGHAATLCASGVAVSYLRDRGVEFDALDPMQDALALIEEYRPALVVTGTSENVDSLGLALLDASRRLRIRSVAAVDAFANSANRFRGRGKEAFERRPDEILVPDEWTARAYESLRFPKAHLHVCGHPHYDRVLAARADYVGRAAELREAVVPGVQEGERILLFAAEVSTGLDGSQFRRSPQYTMSGTRSHDGRTEIVLEELLLALDELPRRPRCVLRLHPKNTHEDLLPYRSAFDSVSSGGSGLDALAACDLAVGMTTMLLLEAAILGKQTLSIVPREIEREWLVTTRQGITPCATSRAQLRALLGAWARGEPLGRELPMCGGSLATVVSVLSAWLPAVGSVA